MSLTSADVDRLDQLAAMLEAIPKVAAESRRILAADQSIREAEEKARKINAENADTMQASARIRDEIAAAQAALKKATADAETSRANMLADANARAQSLVVNAQAAAKEILLRAHDEADQASRRAVTIDQTIADKTADAAKLEKRIDNARTQLKKMLET